MTPVPMEAPSDCSDTTVTTEGFTLAYTSWAVRGWPWGSRQARRTPGSPWILGMVVVLLPKMSTMLLGLSPSPSGRGRCWPLPLLPPSMAASTTAATVTASTAREIHSHRRLRRFSFLAACCQTFWGMGSRWT